MILVILLDDEQALNSPGLNDQRKGLKEWLSGVETLVIGGVGNRLRGDDYVGICIAERLQLETYVKVKILVFETVPENFLDEIEKINPSHILIVDAAMLGKPAIINKIDLVNNKLIAILIPIPSAKVRANPLIGPVPK